MKILKNDFLIDAYNAAKSAADGASLSKNDTVLHFDDADKAFSSRKWVKLGGRERDFKAANREIRKQLWANLVDFFGGRENIDNLPKALRKELKIADFKLDSDGQVTSSRPLTARRIIAICTMAKKWKEGSEKNPQELLAARSCSFEDKVKAFVFRLASTKQLSEGDIELMNKILDRFENFNETALKTVLEKTVGRSSKEQCIVFGRYVEKISGVAAEFVQNYDRLDEQMRTEAEFNRQVDAAVNDFDFDQEITEQELKSVDARAFMRFATEVIRSRKEEYENVEGGVNPDLNGGDSQVGRTKYVNILDSLDLCFALKTDRLGCKPLLAASVKKMEVFRNWLEAEKNGREPYDKLSHVERYRAAFPAANLTDEEIEAEFNEFKARKADYDRRVQEENEKVGAWNEQLDQKNREIDVDNAALAQWNMDHEQEIANGTLKPKALKPHAQPKAKYSGPDYPSVLTAEGRSASVKLRDELNMSSHAGDNTAQQMLDAFTVFAELDELFFECLDMDRANGNTEKFEALMDALNYPGCIQFRATPVLAVKGEVELNVNLNVSGVAKTDAVEVGFSNKLQQLFAEGGDLRYDNVVKEYLTAVGEGATIKIGVDFIERMLKNPDLTENATKALMACRANADEDVADVKSITEIKVSAAFFAEPSVRNAMFDMFVGMFADET